MQDKVIKSTKPHTDAERLHAVFIESIQCKKKQFVKYEYVSLISRSIKMKREKCGIQNMRH